MPRYKIEVSNYFDADSAEDAVSQMVAWLKDDAEKAGYRVIFQEEESTFVDAEDMFARMDEDRRWSAIMGSVTGEGMAQ